MPAVSTQSVIPDMFKRIYKNRDLTNLSVRKTILGDKISSKPELVGESLTYPIHYGLGWGIHPTLNASTPAAKATYFSKWVIPCDQPSKLYGRLALDIPTMMRSASDVGSYMRLKNKELMNTLDNMKMQRKGVQLWSDGAMDIGRVKAVTGSNPATSFTITNFNDALKFDASGHASNAIGQTIVFNATRTGSAGTIKASTWKVTAVEIFDANGDTKITVTRLTGSGAGVDPAANDYVYVEGFYDQGFKGIPAWIPTATPTSTAFYGVDRTKAPEFLAGFRGSWEGTIRDSASRTVSIMAPYFDPGNATLWLSPERWYQLHFELKAENQLVIDDATTMKWGTSAMKLITPQGVIPVLSDAYAPKDAGYIIDHTHMEYLTTGPMIHMADEDLEALRLSDDDGLEIRIRSLALFRVDKPHTCGVFPISQS
jgi:hypothetical protein